jgi:hypothetical protein
VIVRAGSFIFPFAGSSSFFFIESDFFMASKSRFDLPDLSVSIKRSGSTRIKRLRLMLPEIKGMSATCTSNRLIFAISGRDPHGAFWKATPSTTMAGEKPILRLIFPASVSSRPVASLAARVI